MVLTVGLSAPTGDIDNINPVAAGMATPFPYTMRLGHGTWDARPGATYRYFWDRASIGFQGLFDLPMGLNDAHYRVGDEYRVTGWFAYLLDAEKRLAVSYRVEGLWRTDYIGADPRLNPFSMSRRQREHACRPVPKFRLWCDVQAAVASRIARSGVRSSCCPGSGGCAGHHRRLIDCQIHQDVLGVLKDANPRSSDSRSLALVDRPDASHL